MDTDQLLERSLRAGFEARLPLQIARAGKIRLQSTIPNHWFSAAASECAAMYITGHFYGAILVAQAYVEALAEYLCRQHTIGRSRNVTLMWKRLHEAGVVEGQTQDAAASVYSDRHSFHHLNDRVEQDHSRLEERALSCVNQLHIIESDVFAHTFQRGRIIPKTPKYWPQSGPQAGMVDAYIRNITI
jgi:hypothetical protein